MFKVDDLSFSSICISVSLPFIHGERLVILLPLAKHACTDRAGKNGGNMSLRSPTFVARVFEKGSNTAKQLLSRALTTFNQQNACNFEDDLATLSSEISTFGENLATPVGLNLVTQLQQRNGSLLNPYFVNQIISYCAKHALLDVGVQVHPFIVKTGFASNLYISTALVAMYGERGEIVSSQKLFDEMNERNVVTWNALISGYLHVKSPKDAVELFMKMLEAGIEPTPTTVSAILVGCSQFQDERIGAQVHGVSLKLGFYDNVVLETGLLDMYSKCGNVEGSRRVFDHMQGKNVITWTCMVTAYAQHGLPDEAMMLVRKMLRLGLRSNYMTYNSLLSSFSAVEYLDCCKQIHCRVICEGFEFNEYIVVTLVTVYSKCGCSLEDFQKLRSNVSRWDQISWNAVIAGLCNLECGEQALKCFSEMRQAGNEIDYFTFTSIIGVLGVISGLREGKQMHALIFKSGYASSVFLQNGLITMYARCGAISDSKKVFSSMNEHDVISWNSLISGCANHGYGSKVVELFEQMRRTEIRPNGTTFLAVLSACSHAEFIDKGLEYFYLMRDDASLESPRVEHYAAVVDLFGRAGYLSEAESFISAMPIDPGPSVYKALLSACHVHGNREIAVRSANKLIELWPNDPATYVLLSNVFMSEGYWDDATELRALMYDRGVTKKPGYSLGLN